MFRFFKKFYLSFVPQRRVLLCLCSTVVSVRVSGRGAACLFPLLVIFSSDVRVALSICTRNLSVWTIYFSPSRAGKLSPLSSSFSDSPLLSGASCCAQKCAQ